MVMAPTAKVVLGSIAFLIFWVLIVFPTVPLLPIGRTDGTLLGVMLMVAFRVITPDEAYAAIDLPILGLLSGTMVVSIYLERAGMFKYLGKLLYWKNRGGKVLLCHVYIASAVSSALFTNGTCCVVFTEFILKIARQNNLPPQLFLLALASSTNIGSAATPIGNPQNLVIVVQSRIQFWGFLKGVLPEMVVGVMVNIVILLCYFWKVLPVEKDEESAVASIGEMFVEEDVTSSHQFSPMAMSHNALLGSVDGDAIAQGSPLDSGVLSENEVNLTREVVGGVSSSRHGRVGNKRNGFVEEGFSPAMDEKEGLIEK